MSSNLHRAEIITNALNAEKLILLVKVAGVLSKKLNVTIRPSVRQVERLIADKLYEAGYCRK